MDLALESEFYEPIMGNDGNYCDQLASSSKFKNGIKCMCGTRKDHVFYTRSSFTSHIKVTKHQEWLATLNSN